MAVTEHMVKLITHTARMQMMDEQRPKHNGAKNYRKVIRRYQVEWDDLSAEQRKEAKERALDLDDMTPELITAAVAALEA